MKTSRGIIFISIIGYVSLVLGLGLLALVIYLIPYSFFKINYNVPTFIAYFREYLLSDHNITYFYIQMLLLLLPLIAGSLLLFFLSRRCTIYLEYHQGIQEEKLKMAEKPEQIIEYTIEQGTGAYYKHAPRFAKMVQPKNYVIHPLIVELSLILLVLLLLALIEILVFEGASLV